MTIPIIFKLLWPSERTEPLSLFQVKLHWNSNVFIKRVEKITIIKQFCADLHKSWQRGGSEVYQQHYRSNVWSFFVVTHPLKIWWQVIHLTASLFGITVGQRVMIYAAESSQMFIHLFLMRRFMHSSFTVKSLHLRVSGLFLMTISNQRTGSSSNMFIKGHVVNKDCIWKLSKCVEQNWLLMIYKPKQ